ncbi:MAG TPA: M20 family peptidase [Thiothrix sp.]|nr:M20 family peptidase [Thiothrix sp.]
MTTIDASRWKESLATLVNINSHTFNKQGVDQVSDCFTAWMDSLGFEAEYFPRQHIGDHVLYRAPHSDFSTHPQKVLLLGHADTVFAPNTFEGFREDDQWVYGPGVCDMKGGLVVAYEALRQLSEANGNTLNHIDFLLVSDEETGSDDSKHLSAKLAQDYEVCFVFEAAGERGEVVTGRKGVGTFTATIQGKGAHAGVRYAEGINANLEAAIKTQKLSELMDLSKGTTVNVGKMQGGIGANTVSPEASLLFEIRYTQLAEKNRVLTGMQAIIEQSFVAGTHCTLSGDIQRDVMEPSDAQQRLLTTLNHINGSPLLTEFRGGVSDANIVSAAGVATLDGFGPFGDGDHTVHERASKQSFVERIQLMHDLLAYHQQYGRLYE